MRNVSLALLAVVGLCGGTSFASPTFYAVDASKTSSILHGGDRELTSLGFVSNTTIWNGSNFLNWRDGRLTNNVGTYGWNAAIARDMNSSGNAKTGNPDRADAATPFAGEGAGTGTLREVFGPFNGYKNMSYIVDGEDDGAYTLDLYFQSGLLLNSDASANTVELSILERGGNSDMQIQGIFANGTLTSPITMLRSATGSAGWTLDTLEIAGAQSVNGVGISLDDSWDGLAGFRFTATASMNGPDIVAVGTDFPVPSPGGVILGCLGMLWTPRRVRK